jgi:protocatechuate 3,4-dioxygenase beta subunit
MMQHRDQKADFHITRRELLSLLGAAMLVRRADAQPAPASSGTGKPPACILTAEQTEGPYFVDRRLKRSDIRADPSDGSVRAGIPLTLLLRISSIDAGGCMPVAGAMVDIWHCDANGVYSDVADPSVRTAGKQFLRGYQVTDGNGAVQFTTIYPGWYPGRAVHIHFKVRAKSKSGANHELTSQLYFDDAVTGRVHAQAPYSGRGKSIWTNERDGIFRHGGRHLMLALAGSGQGYDASFDIGLRMA